MGASRAIKAGLPRRNGRRVRIGESIFVWLVGHASGRLTRREAANRFMLFFFFLLIAVNVYFLFEHLQEMEMHVVGVVEFGFYTVFYVNLFILGIVGLIYYLNSYSRKSVYFITLVMTLVLADVLRDMAAFYLRDTSVLLMESILRFGSVFLAFQFFATEEKKLRLINLV